MSELLVTLLRLSYLVLLWLLVLLALGVLRRDVFGTRVLRRGAPPRPAQQRPRPEPRAAVVGKPGPPPRTSAAAATGGAAPTSSTGPPPARSANLLITDGALRGRTVRLGSAPILLGRSPACTVVLEDDYASNRHARIYPDRGGWWLEDLGSTNGTFVDGNRIEEPVELVPGRQVRIGQTVLELQR
jgi:pSer/pThr/pTyr-binding forkhead associated (FHA) protein